MNKNKSLSNKGLEKASGGKYDVVNDTIDHIKSDDPFIQAGIDSYYNDRKDMPTYGLANETMAQQNRSIRGTMDTYFGGKNGNHLKHYDVYSNPSVK